MKSQIDFYENKLAYEMDPSDLYGALQDGDSVVVVDARKPASFRKEHIPGAVNLPHATMTADSMKDFDRSKLYVCYCDGIGCNASTKGALNMTRLGFRVRELIGGIEWWKIDGYATEGAHPLKGAGIQCAC